MSHIACHRRFFVFTLLAAVTRCYQVPCGIKGPPLRSTGLQAMQQSTQLPGTLGVIPNAEGRATQVPPSQATGPHPQTLAC